MLYSQRLIVRQAMPQYIQFNTTQEDTKTMSTWCCLSKGPSSIRCNFEKNTYTPDENARILCDVDNSRCKLKVVAINIRLNQKIELRSDTRNIKLFQRIVCSRSYPGVEAHHNTGVTPRFLELLLKDLKPSKIKPRKNQKAYLEEDMELASQMQPTTKGSKIDCSYFLTIELQYEGCICCSAPPIATLILNIIPQALTSWGQVQAPQDWNPIVYPEAKLVFPDTVNLASQPVIMTPQPLVMTSPQPNRF